MPAWKRLPRGPNGSPTGTTSGQASETGEWGGPARREAIVLGQTADGIALGVRFRFHAELLAQAKHQSLLADAVTKVLGRPANIVVEVKPDVFTKQEEELLKMAEELL